LLTIFVVRDDENPEKLKKKINWIKEFLQTIDGDDRKTNWKESVEGTRKWFSSQRYVDKEIII
jgi:hypothetical protein